ncbi:MULTISPECIES: LytTR family DNA-binding domain-containing protein [unclassified Spirosoma]|uniref:LytR/AlgR family response regulator transcription factor n=1 Tax=unclassified Spirosoma TaxID=2621999 RepID=UPI00095F2630|nr:MULTISPECIES: LytTR family DNA-binding domain-containing protein [unclassified Spirosoma]MBN8822785.1 LytTR family transcriptional regulator [Spirosoma sp.]OJW79993.1 MAG: histidine kinase [Spirosoma sp. 48-14]
MFRFLNQPYPSEDSPGRELQKAALIGLFVGLFLWIFQPFGINNWDTPNKDLKIAGFGLVTFLVTAFNFIVWRRLFPKPFSEEQWTVGREIIFVIANILLIAIANQFYLGTLLGATGHSGMSWFGAILITFSVGIFPVVGLVSLNYIRQLKKYSQAAATLPIHSLSADEQPGQKETEVGVIPQIAHSLTLVAENEKDNLILAASELLYIESSDNYCTVVYLKNNHIAKPLLRSSLSRLEKQIAQPHIVRCHRSYVVNLNRVERVTGNAQGYKLHILGGQFQIPVARQYNETLVAELKSL